MASINIAPMFGSFPGGGTPLGDLMAVFSSSESLSGSEFAVTFRKFVCENARISVRIALRTGLGGGEVAAGGGGGAGAGGGGAGAAARRGDSGGV